MKFFKRSQTSSKININSNEIETKKIKSINEKFEETIKKIANFLKQNDQNLNLPKLKDKKKEVPIFKKKDSKKKIKFNNEIFNLDVINYILNKTKKTPDEILIIKVFLSSMNFLSSLKGSFNSDKLLYSLSNYLKMEKKNKDSLIFRFGNKGNKFYVLIRGEVSVLILKEIKVQICFKRYFLHLLLLKMLKEDELVKKCITANAKIKYHFDDRDFDIYYEKIVNFVNKYMIEQLNKKKKSNEEDKDDIREANKQFFIKKNSIAGYNNNFQFNKNKDIGVKNSYSHLKNKDNNRLNAKRKTAKNFSLKNKLSSKFLTYHIEEHQEEEEEEESEDKEINYSNADLPFFSLNDIKEIVHYYIYLKEKIDSKPKNISVRDYIKLTYLDSPFHKNLKNEEFTKKEELLLFKYFEITKKKAGDSFGELALQREDNKRTGTIITLTDCTLGILSRNDYNVYLGDIEVKKRKNEINFVMSFSIFDKMNKIVFENRFFNFFTKEIFPQGKDIIIQDHKVNKVFFIMEGQFEIMTNLSLFNIYSLLHQKTNRIMDKEKMKMKFPREDYNLRLYISYNKDILGLEDCCVQNNISFVTAKCISDKGCAFTIEKSILNEIRHKISEIDKNINIIKIKREKVMVDRLANIYNRIIQSRNKNKKDKFNENDKTKNSFKYINYFFGINQGDRNSNIKKILTKKSPTKRIRSALLLSSDNSIYKNFNIDDYTNCNIPDYNISNNANSNYYSKTRIIDSSKLSEGIQKDRLSPKSEIMIKNSEKGRNNLDVSLKEKISEIMDSSLSQSKTIDQHLLLKPSDKINIKNNKDKLSDLYNSINKMITKEYSKLINWMDNRKTIEKRTIQIKKRNSRLLSNRIMERRNSSDKNFLSFNRNRKKLSLRQRPLSNINPNKMSLKKENESMSRNISNFYSDFDKESRIYKLSNYNSYKNYKNRNRISRALSPDLKPPTKLKGKINLEKFLKRMLGTRYKDHFISYEEQKFNKLIESYNIQDDFMNKAKKVKLKIKKRSEKEIIKNTKEYKKIDNRLKDIMKITDNN